MAGGQPDHPPRNGVRPIFLRRVLVRAVAAVLSATLLWITERTSAGTTTVSWSGDSRKLLKQQWSTTKTRTGQRATWWKVTTAGQMDHQVTWASCGL
jgi:hypothetical protein